MRATPTASGDSPERPAPRGGGFGLVCAACLAGAAPAQALPAGGGPCLAGACVLARPAHPFAYVTGLDGGVSQFAAGPGGLTALSPATVSGGIPSAVAGAPDGTTVYVASLSDDPIVIAQLLGLFRPAVHGVRGSGGSGFAHEVEALRAVEREAGRAFAAIGMAEIAGGGSRWRSPIWRSVGPPAGAGSPSMRGIDRLRICSAALSMAARASSR
jgi:hypothetical protein